MVDWTTNEYLLITVSSFARPGVHFFLNSIGIQLVCCCFLFDQQNCLTFRIVYNSSHLGEQILLSLMTCGLNMYMYKTYKSNRLLIYLLIDFIWKLAHPFSCKFFILLVLFSFSIFSCFILFNVSFARRSKHESSSSPKPSCSDWITKKQSNYEIFPFLDNIFDDQLIYSVSYLYTLPKVKVLIRSSRSLNKKKISFEIKKYLRKIQNFCFSKIHL